MSDAPEPNEVAGDGGLVWVDALGTPVRHDDVGEVRVAVIGVGEATRRRLDGMDGYSIVDLDAPGADREPADADALPQVVLVSTRLPRTEAISHVALHREMAAVVALVHTGGETLAADLLRAGARGLLAEGNETTARAFLTRSGQDTGLLEVYDRQIGRSQVIGSAQRSQDAVTRLPNGNAFEARIAEAQLAGDVPRVGFVRLLFLQGGQRTVDGAVPLIRRRLARRFAPLAEAYGIDLFALDDAEFAFVGDELSPNRAETLGAALGQQAAAYAPWGPPLAVAVGHAGSEVSQDPVTVRQLAERAVEVAAMEQRSTVVGAETLALGASSTTELEAALRLVDVVERHDPLGPGHAERVADLAAAIAWELGYEGKTGSAIRLAAHLHDVGKVSLPVEAMFDTEALTGELAEAARSHPVRAADYLRPLAGGEVAAAVRAHHERWDGTGFPDGLAGDEIPVAARIIAVAGDYARWSLERPHAEALALVLDGAGSAYDPAVVEAATPLLTARLAAAHSLVGAGR
jgi:HD-GYP domain-containing protein (c-di-GMP phosphodiesterase class II)